MFAGFVPEIMEILGKRERYRGSYEKPSGVKYVHLKTCKTGANINLLSRVLEDGCISFNCVVVIVFCNIDTSSAIDEFQQ